MTSYRRENWERVRKSRPCPICENDGWCSVTDDGALCCCMRVGPGDFQKQGSMGPEYYWYLTNDPDRRRPFAPEVRSRPASTFDIPAARSLYGVMVNKWATMLINMVSPRPLAELERRFGIEHAITVAERFRIGYCPAHALKRDLESMGRNAKEAKAAGLLWSNGEAARGVADKLIIPHRRGGATWDLRGSGLKGGEDGTKEISLPGSYADKGVAGLFFNHDDLDALGEGQDIHIGGGAWKVMALALCGLSAIGTRGEAELTDAQLAEIAAKRPGRIVVHIDAEDPKEGRELSAGRKLVLAKAERLRTIAPVFIAEPPREPGTPKVDADSLLRDHGVAMLRAVATSAPSLEAFRVAIGVDAPGTPADVLAKMEGLERVAQQERQRAQRAQKTLTSYVYVHRNPEIKAEKDTLAASTMQMMVARDQGRVTPGGRYRQTLRSIAESVGKSKKTISKHLDLGKDEKLWDRQLLIEEAYRDIDGATGQSREMLRLLDPATRKVVEELPAEIIFGRGSRLAPDGDRDEGANQAYYIIPAMDPEAIFDALVTLKPQREEGKTWGGKRDTCPACQSQRTHRETRIVCDDCGHISAPIRATSPLPPEEGSAEALAALHAESLPDEPRADAPSVPPTPIAPAPIRTYPPSATGPIGVVDPIEEEADDWDPYECNQAGCTRRSLPEKRYCDQHDPGRLARLHRDLAPVAQPIPPPFVVHEGPSEAESDETPEISYTVVQARAGFDWGDPPLAPEAGRGYRCAACDEPLRWKRQGDPLLCVDCTDLRNGALLADVAAGGGA